jgi:uncharacterized repeat protein (TIGR01451 family)
MLFQTGETITTYESDCATPSNSFELGDTVCAKVTGVTIGAPGGFAPRRVNWVARTGSVTQASDVTTAAQSFSFTLPSSETTIVTDAGGGTVTVDNRGVWRVYIADAAEASFRTGTTFTVTAPTPYVDLQLSQSATVANARVAAGSTGIFEVFVTNAGPNAAASVVVSDTLPANTTFVSQSESTNVGFTCTPPATAGDPAVCTVASMPVGSTARLLLAYTVDAGTAAGTLLTNVASGTSATAELEPGDNTASFDAAVPTESGPETCTLICHEDMVVTANATQGGNPGAFVTFGAATGAGECGTVNASPASGTFFPVGVTVVNVTSQTGGGSCSFTVNVVTNAAPTISCPADKSAADDGSGSATVNVGTPTAAPSGVSVAGVRDDGEALNAPYPVGTTAITWTATDSFGRTASCTQRITVTGGACPGDTTPPTITAPANINVGTGPDSSGCSVAIEDSELGEATATDDCPSGVTITRTGVPAGGVFPIGTTTITYTATDTTGLQATATQTVTVIDDTKPVIVAPPDAAYTCLSDVPAAHPSQATRGVVLDEDGNPLPPGPPFDNCGVPVVTVSETSTGAGSAASPRVITRTFRATDAAGNFSDAIQTITVIDPTPPVLTLNGPTSVTVECHTSFTDPGASATDNCGSAAVTVTGSVNVNVPGTYTLTYTATDSAGNVSAPQTRTVTVVDTLPPTISCQADVLVDFNPAVGGAVVTYSAPVGTDSCAGTLTATQTTGLASGATFPLGTTTNTFVVTDGAGLTASCSFKVTVALTSIVGLDSVSITGAGPVDSYDSNGGYSATKGSLANVLSNGTITMTGSAKVAGNVRSTRAGVVMSGASQVTGNATAGTTVSRSGSASVGGVITNNALAPVISLQPVPTCGPPYSSNSGISGSYSYNASTGDLSLSGVNVATLANGTYCFHNLSVTSSSQLKVNGPVTIRLTGTLSTGGAASINNTTLNPSNLRILSSYTGSNGVSFGNSASAHLVVYAPGTGVTISGASPLFGTVAGKSITISNSGMLHYDTRLQSIWPDMWLSIFGP